MKRRGTQPTDRLTLIFTVLFAAILLAQVKVVTAWPWLLLADALVVGLLALLRLLPAQGGFAESIGGAYPLILVGGFYTQLGLIQVDAGRLYDLVVQRWSWRCSASRSA